MMPNTMYPIKNNFLFIVFYLIPACLQNHDPHVKARFTWIWELRVVFFKSEIVLWFECILLLCVKCCKGFIVLNNKNRRLHTPTHLKPDTQQPGQLICSKPKQSLRWCGLYTQNRSTMYAESIQPKLQLPHRLTCCWKVTAQSPTEPEGLNKWGGGGVRRTSSSSITYTRQLLPASKRLSL